MQLRRYETPTRRHDQSFTNIEILVQEYCRKIHVGMKIIQVEGLECLHGQGPAFANVHEIYR
jgi:hypothetical protein